ncbi:nucleoside 2-deoxyribosyltransferase [Caballeronia sp. GAWG1-1]|uniref:nucleoside 2-deoxyribosyltransferase n=1 Tax=Caballeronia sp. GAWG1-1 TaxID=2921742 RepID=UPI00202849FA
MPFREGRGRLARVSCWIRRLPYRCSRSWRLPIGLCREEGFLKIYPFDCEAPANLGPAAKAAWICRANIDAIRSADVVMANLNDFRGLSEPDSGTAFDVGFAAALGKPVWAYRFDARSLVEQIVETCDPAPSLPVCARGYVVENFGLSVNLLSHFRALGSRRSRRLPE